MFNKLRDTIGAFRSEAGSKRGYRHGTGPLTAYEMNEILDWWTARVDELWSEIERLRKFRRETLGRSEEEPTEAMIEAGAAILREYRIGDSYAALRTSIVICHRVYRAMRDALGASPTPE